MRKIMQTDNQSTNRFIRSGGVLWVFLLSDFRGESADHFGLVYLRAQVRASTSIRVQSLPMASNIDIDRDASAGPIATVRAFSNTTYNIRLFSDNLEASLRANIGLPSLGGPVGTQFFLRQSGTSAAAVGTLGERINYQLTFDGVAVVPDDDGSVLVGLGAPTGNVGYTASLNIVIEGNQNFSAGIYSDLLTLIISPDTSVPLN